MSLLDQMAEGSRDRVRAALRAETVQAIRARALATDAPVGLVLTDFDLIAECKLRAPSSGRLGAESMGPEDIAERARSYGEAGAAAVSVLTEPLRFDGHLDHMKAAAGLARVPVMRKDFLVSPIQIYEARAGGAGGVLLITRMLDDAALEAMLDGAEEMDLFALVECFDAEDAKRTAQAISGRSGQLLVGVNTRDLRTLEVVPTRLAQMVADLPPGVPWVAESGMATSEDVGAAAALGYRLALVGTALMRAPDPGVLVRQMKEAGRAACG